MQLRSTPHIGDIYFFLDDRDNERLDVWNGVQKDFVREQAGIVFIDRKQLRAYLDGKLCDTCSGYGNVANYKTDGEGHTYKDGTTPCVCQITK